MYVVEYGGRLYGPFGSLQAAGMWRPSTLSPDQGFTNPFAFKVRALISPDAPRDDSLLQGQHPAFKQN